MPMDYDGDGDMDLLVACPDKPSNGVYFFENPTQNPKVKDACVQTRRQARKDVAQLSSQLRRWRATHPQAGL